jgi:hypothetical protein
MYLVCLLPITVDKFDNDILSRHLYSPYAKSDAVRAVFQEANIFELDVFMALRVSSD